MTIPTVLETAHDALKLPVYFPDATRGAVRAVDSKDLEACGVQGLVVNAFHLSNRPGAGLIKSSGGMHTFMGWRRPIASDSGGFQLMSMIRENARYGTISHRGIHFTELSGNRKKVLFTPERSVRLQFELGADLMICLDDCPSPNASPEEVQVSVRRTIQWAERCQEEFQRQLQVRRDPGPKPRLFGVIQGGYDKAAREACAEGLLALGFDGFGFGGWPLTPQGNLADEILAHTAQLTPDHLPRFALGVGKPEHIVNCYQMGWRIFDCVLPTRDARHGRLYAFDAPNLQEVDLLSPSFYHSVYVRDEKHKRQKQSISEACDCPCCQRYSLGYLHHLFNVEDPLALRLATLHNLRFYTQLLERITQLDDARQVQSSRLDLSSDPDQGGFL
jgi:queuine tRNA-ribosyltransferase